MKKPRVWTRYYRRLFKPFLSPADKARIAQAIAEAERHTTGEIHVHLIERAGKEEILEAARRIFKQLGLDKTDGRNGVLILISHLDHRFAIWGDEGIHAKAGQTLWQRASGVLLEHFKARRYGQGVEACVLEVGAELALHFPKTDEGSGKNQLSNEVTESE